VNFTHKIDNISIMCAIFTIIFYFPKLLTGTFISDRTDCSGHAGGVLDF